MSMQYISTRGTPAAASFEDSLLHGLAPDGGLFVPRAWPNLPGKALPLSYADQALAVLEAFGAGRNDRLARLMARALAGFTHKDTIALRQLDERLFLLELFHGPSAAFKDLAMQVLAQLLEALLEARGENLLLLTATSGDTGAAAVQAFKGSARIRLLVLHPLGRVSPVQRRQMTTCASPNIVNLAVEGDFDACQRLVKAVLGAARPALGWGWSSVNSINWGRLAGQIPYFLWASERCAGSEPPRFVVPTGNFGDAFSGWAARACGGRIGPLLAAVNANDSLARLWADGQLRSRTTIATSSVSMDVQAPSNLERLVFEAAGRDGAPVRAAFEAFTAKGQAQLSPAILEELRRQMGVISLDEAKADAAMHWAYQRFGEILCPHTAVGLAGALARDYDGPTILLATAHPAKFAPAVQRVLGIAPALPEALAGLEGLPEHVQTCQADAAEITRWAQQLAQRD